MKFSALFFASALMISTAFAEHHEEKKKMGHDVEHSHVEGAKMDHSHEEAHHGKHDHKAHHADHKDEKKEEKKTK